MEKANRYKLKPGSLLVASPLLRDSNFARAVVLILDRDSGNGHIGLILNHRLDITLADVCGAEGTIGKEKIFNGGPVDLQRLFWVHSIGNKIEKSIELMPGIYVGGDFDSMRKEASTLSAPETEIHFYLGYSGWNAGQLEHEIEEGAWGVIGNLLDPRSIFDTEGLEMWHKCVRILGEPYRHWLALPPDPSLN